MIPEPEESSSKGPPAPVRAHAASLAGSRPGQVIPLSEEDSRHLVRVRRLEEGAILELFDDAGRTARGSLVSGSGAWAVRLLAEPRLAPAQGGVTIYTAIPKGNRADWMVEKLSELGAAALVPLVTARSIVEPGAGKLERFARLARESAKQSRRSGVLRVESPASLQRALEMHTQSGQRGAVLATEIAGRSLAELDAAAVFIGPEGGWTPGELEMMTAAGLASARLTGTILRVETAAVAAAAVLQVCRGPG